MKKLLTGIVVCVVVFGVVGSSLAKGDAEGKKTRDPGAAFDKKDANGDGKLSLEEYVGKKEGDKADKLKAAFQKKDKDSDGSLTKDEMAAKGKKKKKKADE